MTGFICKTTRGWDGVHGNSMGVKRIRRILFLLIVGFAVGRSLVGRPRAAAGPGRTPVYRINLRVHRGRSNLPAAELRKALEEMNSIWWSQAGVCFEITSSLDD